eukprot:4157877-Alexandrium_andersonii.AAC.1
MSASLVGSEMCIRDRGTAHQAPSTGHRAPGAGRRAPSTVHRAPGTGATVSYTHLTLPTICSV